MVISKSLRALKRRDGTGAVLLENKQDSSEALLFERGAIAALTATEKANIYKDYKEPVDSFGCLGVLRLDKDNTSLSYLVLVTGCTSVGRILEVELCRVTQVTLLPLVTAATGQPDQVTDVVKFLSTGSFFFSYPSDSEKFQLSSSAQYRCCVDNNNSPYFLWNRALMVPLQQYGIDNSRWLLRLMCGSVEVKTLYCGRHQARACLISRFGCERAGTRFSVRGVDDDGHAATFFETEQVIVLHDKLTSYVQVRGSVPIFWEQTGIQGVGSHRIQLTRGDEFTRPAFDKHMKWLIDKYGHTLLVNLLGNKEAEQVLSDAYQKHLKHSIYCNDVSMVTFDYNSHCRGNDKSHLDGHLLPQTVHYIEPFDFFAAQGDHMIRKQVGVIRTNCMDCMDRSNVVQGFYGLKMLQKQLLEYDLGTSTSIISQFEDVFQSMWSRNGNNISLLVTGSAALSKKDRLKDGALSIQRSIQNNFFDSSKQEAIELLLWSNVFNDQLGQVTRALLPSTDVFSSRAYRQDLTERYMEYTDSVPIRVCAGTWNVNGGKYTQSIAYKNQSMTCWLLDAPMAAIPNLRECPPDIYAIGFEELVDLNASNIVNTSSTNRKYWGKELQKIFSADNYKYCLLTSHQLVGLCLYIFVRPHLAPYIRDVAVSTVKTGMSGKVGNKGAVGIRMLLHSTPLSFVCAHLTAHQSHINERNNDFNEIWKKMSFPNDATLSSHEYVFWCGDLNYRIDLAIDKVKEAITAQNWSLLQKHDQLLKSKYAGKAFQGFVEGELNFAPTYKYDSFSDDYDTSEKGRIPAWTDRIMWWYHSPYKPSLQPSNHGSISQGAHPTDMLLVGKDHMRLCAGSCDLNWNPGKLMFYGRAELKTSDHRPVIAVIDIEVVKVNNHKRQLVTRDVYLSLGPPDCTIVILGNVELADIQSELLQFGEIVFVRLLEEQLLVTYKESKSALAAVALNGSEVNGALLNVKLFTKWPPPVDDITMTTSSDDEISSKMKSLELPVTSGMLVGSSHSSPRTSPYFSPKGIESPSESPRGSLHSSPWQSVHSSPYHSAENSPHPSPCPSPQLSPKLERRKPTTVEETPEELYEGNSTASVEDESLKPTVTMRSSSTSPPHVSQFQELLDKVPTTSPVQQGSTKGIGLPYNVHHHTHGQEQNGKVVVSKPARPPPMKPQAKSSAGEKLPPPKRPPPPTAKQLQLPVTTSTANNKPPRPPLPTKND